MLGRQGRPVEVYGLSRPPVLGMFSERENYELQCQASWVIHFDRKYKYEKFKAEYLQKGYERIDNENEPKS